ncbi:MAG TPA: tetratricopeptide repeat protein [Anaerolineaceae bacterium]
MPIGIVSASPAPLAENRMTELQAILTRHDLQALDLFERYLQSLLPGAEHLAAARAVADYFDQRGWRLKAHAHYSDLLTYYRADSRAQTRLQLDLAEMSLRWSDLPQMRVCLEQARAEFARQPDEALEADLLRGEALLACLTGDLPSAKTGMQQALDAYTRQGGWPKIALGLNGMSYICLNGRQWDEAVGYTRQALHGDQTALNQRLRGDLLSNHGYALRRQRGNRVALPWVEDAYALRVEQRDALLISRTGVNLAEIQRALGRLQEAEAVLQRGLEELRGIGMQEQAGSVANTLGALRFTQGDYTGAAAAYQEALRCARALGQARLEGIICTNQAEVYYQWGDFRTASTWYARCAEVYAAEGDLSKAVDAWLQAARLITWIDPREIHPILDCALEVTTQHLASDPHAILLAEEIRQEIEILSGSGANRPELRIQPRPARPESLPPLPAPEQIDTVDDDLAHLLEEFADSSVAPWEMDRFSERLQAVIDAGRLASASAREVAQSRLAAMMSKSTPAAPTPPRVGGLQLGTDVDFASYLALICGSLAEAGANPELAIPPLMAAFDRALTLALEFKSACGADLDDLLRQPDPRTLRDQVANLDPQAAALPGPTRAWNSLRGYCLGALALLARSPASRRGARGNSELRDKIVQLLPDCPELALLEELLSAPDGEEMLVIHPGLKRGYRVRVSGVSSNSQLHTLLAYLLVGDPQGGWLPGVRPNRRIMAAERGTLVPWESLVAQSIFNMVSWRGVLPDGELSEDPATWILGEGRPSDIPRFEGQWVMLMGPLPYQLTWIAGPKFHGLQAEVILEEIMAQPEVERLLARMSAAVVGG